MNLKTARASIVAAVAIQFQNHSAALLLRLHNDRVRITGRLPLPGVQIPPDFLGVRG